MIHHFDYERNYVLCWKILEVSVGPRRVGFPKFNIYFRENNQKEITTNIFNVMLTE